MSRAQRKFRELVSAMFNHYSERLRHTLIAMTVFLIAFTAIVIAWCLYALIFS